MTTKPGQVIDSGMGLDEWGRPIEIYKSVEYYRFVALRVFSTWVARSSAQSICTYAATEEVIGLVVNVAGTASGKMVSSLVQQSMHGGNPCTGVLGSR